MKNAYAKLKAKQQERVNALPIKFAFSNQQFEKAMQELGLSTIDTVKIYKLGSTGGFYRREDSALIHGTFEQNEQEMQAAIAADKDGTGFVKDMFLYELDNHEYSYTGDLEDTLNALGYTEDEVLENPVLLKALKLACAEIHAQKDY